MHLYRSFLFSICLFAAVIPLKLYQCQIRADLLFENITRDI